MMISQILKVAIFLFITASNPSFGEGIQLKHGSHKGRLIVAGGDFYQDKKVLCFFSDDHGETWERGNVAPWAGEVSWASESKVAELPDGTLVLNSRTACTMVVLYRLDNYTISGSSQIGLVHAPCLSPSRWIRR